MRVVSLMYSKKALYCTAVGVLLGVSAVCFASGGAFAAKSDAKIHAVYKVNFRGFNLGVFKIWSNFSKRKYNMQGVLKLSVLKGVFFKWSGKSESSGSVYSGKPKPASFSFNYKTRRKSARLNMQFAKGAVSQIVSMPPTKPSKKRVPVEEKHMRGVIDPLSALMSLTMVSPASESGKTACKRRISIFDGKERYDLILSYKKTVQLKNENVNSYKGVAYVCRIKYVPIAGHKPHRKSHKFMVKTENIEVWLVPMPAANLYVPYHIVVPTPIGYATLTTTVFEVDTPERGRTAFVQ